MELATDTEATKAVAASCPRCKLPLTDPKGLGWCQSCGYCRSLEDDGVKKLLDVPQVASTPAVLKVGWAAGELPSLFWLTLLGVAGIIVFTLLVPSQRLGPDTLERALWTTLQLGGGILLIFVAQFIALVRVAPEDAQLGIKDLFLPFRLWSEVFKRQPRQFVPVWLGTWGLTLALSAVIFIGGMSHWLHYMPGGKHHVAKRGPR